MSLNAWKLEVCSAASAASSSVPSETPVASAPPPAEQCRHQLQDADAYQRRPPRSTLSLQLQRLEDLASVFPEAAGNNGRSSHDRSGGSDRDELHALVGAREEEEEEEEPTISSAEIEEEYGRGGRGVGSRGGGGKRSRPPLPSASLQSSFISSITPDLPRGPLEPLILSSPGDPTVDEVPGSINCRLLEHQREGVKFLYNLYKKNNGGILGDDMGLGKTIQAIAFLAAVIGKDTEKEIYQSGDTRGHSKERGPILIVCPTSVIHNWGNEFSEWGNFSFSVYHGPNRDLILEKVVSQSVDILITSFDTFRIHDKILCDIQWDIVIIDEAHRLKNEKSQLYRACLGIKTRRRFGLTGTIMQNKILELFNLFDWVSPGSLGTREHFRDFYDEPLKHGQRLSAPERFVQIADERKRHLSSVLNKYLLRRTKEETIGHLMLGKEDNIVFCAMSDLQKRVYRRMLSQPEIQCLINKDLPCTCGSPLKQAECCKRIVPDGVLWSYLHRDNPEGCESCPFCLVLPCIIKLQQISNHLELIKPNPKDDPVKQTKDAELAAAVFGTDVGLVGGSAQSESFMELSDVEHCGKMRALEKLIFLWIQHGDKILLFSYSVRMMDILEKFLIRRGFSFSRLDGSTPMSLRQSLVDEFNRSPSKQVFLISTRAGGLGLNLVSANRVVIFDPNWNPAQDLQAQDRSFRYGQKRHVVVFRLLAAGSVEELVYSRQVYKQQLSNIAVSGKMEKRYFEGVQDCKEFKGELFGICNLFRDLSDKLFTRKRIELCENDAQDSYFDANGEATAAAHVSLSDADNLPKLEDLGILYSHRNEDIVNMRPNSPLKDGDVQFIAKGDIATTSTKTTSLWKSRKTRTVCGKSRPSLDERKRSEYALIAQFKGMEVMEFSRWLLSATPVELEELLRNYKSSKFKQCSSNNG